MLEVYFGNDTVLLRKKVTSVLDDYKKAGATIEILPLEDFSGESLIEKANSHSIFGDQMLYLVDNPSESTKAYDVLTQNLSGLAASPHIFLVVEKALLAAEKKKFAKHAAKMEEFKLATASRFNTFSLAEALAEKNKRNLWVLFSSAKTEGIADEEIIGVLWWQLKALRLAEKTKNSTEAGMKDWPYNKAKKYLSNFKSGELVTLSRSLLGLYHEARSGKTDMSLALEKWILVLR